jgi:hypothetical protein
MPKDKKEDWIQVCPNCGLMLSSKSFVEGAGTMIRSTRGVSPISDLLSCPSCNYTGFPIEVKASDYRKIKFKKRKINSFDPKETHDRKMRQEYGIGFILIFLAIIAVLFHAFFTSCTLVVAGFALIFYALFIKKTDD